MINVDLVQVAILWCIVGLSIICAINARGFLRQIISWLIVVAMVATAAFFTYLEFETVKREIGLSGPSIPQLDVPVPNLNASAGDSLTTDYLAAEKQLLDGVMTIADSVLSFPDWKNILSQGIERRENFESKALALRNRSMNSYSQIRNLRPPPERRPAYDSLLAAADNLRLAGYEVHYQFRLENDAFGESLAKARERASRVKTVISSIINKE
ncbi:MAG: hypothetical protein LBU89_03520 [Fibromonadaceae bacterium]|jgi:hypothetical protein|nr:hypothetical protein [Fibromonadaceae bacterium]